MTSANGNNGGGANDEQRVTGSSPTISGGPKGPITDSLAKPLPKRFYKTAGVDRAAGAGGGFQILLDGRAVKTPKKRPLVLPRQAAAEAVAAEWAAQGARINPATMPLTRFANTAIDSVADVTAEVAADIVAYAGRDLLCYRAEGPSELADAQAQAWDPVLAWAESALGARLTVVAGVMPVEQPEAALRKFAAALEPLEPFRLTAMHVMTTLSGSALLAMAHVRGRLMADEAWAAAHVDEDYQARLWGQDTEAAERRARRTEEFMAAVRFVVLLKQQS